MGRKKNKAILTKEAAKSDFPNTPRELVKPCETKPYFKKETREDYVLATREAARKKAFELAGIDPANAHPGERVDEIRYKKEVIGYRAINIQSEKIVAEVHYHPEDLTGHPPMTTDPQKRDFITEMPHYNYSNWRDGKKDGKYGHVVFQS
jgi:hypothetical protein